MASLTQQLEDLQKQQAILTEKIRLEEERNKKLAQEASVDRLEALIEPITHHLDWICPNQNGVRYNNGHRSDWSARETLNSKFELQLRQICDKRSMPRTKYQVSHMLANEEIFVTLLGIIKKQDARITELEKANKVDNEVDNIGMKRASTVDFSDLQMMKRY